ncbi:DMT family transporter [Chloroflexota bacterium]
MSGEVAAMLSALAWASSSVLMTVSAKRLHVIPLNLVRAAVSALFFLALLPFFGGFQAVVAIPSSQWPWLLLSTLALLVVGDTLFYQSTHLAGVSWAMPVSNINPLWAVLLAALVLGEPLSWSLAAGALLVVAGTVLVGRSTGPAERANPAGGRARRKGLIIALAVSVIWGVGHVMLKPATEGIPAVVANSFRQPLGVLILLGMMMVRGRWAEFKVLDRKSWAVLLLVGLLGGGLAGLFFIIAVQQIGAGRTTVLASVAPILALPFSIMWLRERPTRWTVVGTILTVVGIVLVV